MECPTDASLPGYSGYFSTGKQREIGNSGSVDNRGQEGGPLSELSSNACLSLDLGEQFSYPPYSLNFPDSKKLKPEMEMNLQGNHAVYHVNSNFELPRPMYDNGNHAWISASGPCGIAMFDEKSYQQVRNLVLFFFTIYMVY